MTFSTSIFDVICFQLHDVHLLLVCQHWLRVDGDFVPDDLHAVHRDHCAGGNIEFFLKVSGREFDECISVSRIKAT